MNTKNLSPKDKALLKTVRKTARDIRALLKKNDLQISEYLPNGQIKSLSFCTQGVEVDYNLIGMVFINFNFRTEDLIAIKKNIVKNLLIEAGYDVVDNRYRSLKLDLNKEVTR